MTLDWEGLAVWLLAIAVYLNTLGHGFVYDDNRAILLNPDVQASSPLLQVFQNDFWGTPLSSSNTHGSYRPLSVFSFRLNHWISGFQPFGFHLTNVLLHSIATALVLKTARVLLPGRSPALAAALFAVHPIHAEAVAGLVGRADILASIFYMISFLLYVKHVRVRDCKVLSSEYFVKGGLTKYKSASKKGVLSKNSFIYPINLKHTHNMSYFSVRETFYFSLFLVFALCAVLCKEPGITVIPLALCYDIILHLRSKRALRLKPSIVGSASASMAALSVILLTRAYIMDFRSPTFSKADNPTAKELSILTRTLTFLYLPVFNFLLLVWPRWLSFDWSMDAIPRISSIFDLRFVLTGCFYFLLYRTTRIALDRIRIKRPQSGLKLQNCKVCNKNSEVDHFTSCKVVNNNNLPLQCNCLDPSNQPLSAGTTVTMCLAFLVIPYIPASNMFFYVGFVVAERVLYLPSVGFCLLVALGAHALLHCHRFLALSSCVLLLGTLGGRTLLRNRDWTSEEDLYRSATPINPPKAYGNLGSVLSTAGRLEEAEAALRAALQHRPNMADVHYNLGNLLRRQMKYDAAVESYQLAIQYRPSLAVAYLNLGQVLDSLDRGQQAEAAYRKCCLLDVAGLKDPQAHEEARTACVLRLTGHCKSRACETESLKIVEYQNKQITTTTAAGGTSKTIECQVLLTKEGNRNTADSCVKLLTKNKTMTSQAEELFLSALKKAPTEPGVYVNYGQLLVQQGRRAEAADVYLKAAQLSPRQHALVSSAAIALRHAGRLGEAETLYRQALDLRPADATSHSNLGAILHLQGKFRQAAGCYKEALRLSPGDHVTLTNLQKLRNLLSRNKR